ncbi:hypothetical protein GO013_02225 [Pseudodesulfovibrio sp. JC047]|uniref:DUF7483 domain-containing protein n=1 Tax=Pseudodesulfovibrio sp. JC047 TaxID=2683199 RepID=UPI0013D4D4B7|nr:hypothetical protein [Pseudodesulfovibrio sp. JC047]NDV18235.1 hypothetical protein [Pseudodesulfovibrio sp. JC047]
MLTPKEAGGNISIYPYEIEHSALIEGGLDCGGTVLENMTMALGFKPVRLNTSKPLCDPTNHYLLTIQKTGNVVTVWKQATRLPPYTGRIGTTVAVFLTNVLNFYCGTTKGYYSRLVSVASVTSYADFWQASPLIPEMFVPKKLTEPLHMLLDFRDATLLGMDSTGTNILEWSQDFTHSMWSKSRGDITATNVLAPDGTATATQYTARGIGFTYLLQRQPVDDNVLMTGSSYMKKSSDWFMGCMRILSKDGVESCIDVDLYTGTITSQTKRVLASSINDVGNGWYRCSLTVDSRSGDATTMVLTGMNRTPPKGSSMQFWGAQLEQRSTVSAYTVTRAVPYRGWTFANASQTTDTPTNNYATINPLQTGLTGADITDGNTELHASPSAYKTSVKSTLSMRTGKWYAEFTTSGGMPLPCGLVRSKTQFDETSDWIRDSSFYGFDSMGKALYGGLSGDVPTLEIAPDPFFEHDGESGGWDLAGDARIADGLYQSSGSSWGYCRTPVEGETVFQTKVVVESTSGKPTFVKNWHPDGTYEQYPLYIGTNIHVFTDKKPGNIGLNSATDRFITVSEFSIMELDQNPGLPGEVKDGAVLGLAFDADAGTLAGYYNGVHAYTMAGIPHEEYQFIFGSTSTTQGCANAQFRVREDLWDFAPPHGYKALCTKNLPWPKSMWNNRIADVGIRTGDAASLAGTGDNVFTGGTASASSQYDNPLYDVSLAFDERTDTIGWESEAHPEFPVSIQYECPERQTVAYYTMLVRGEQYGDRTPKSWKVYGSNDPTSQSWDVIDTVDDSQMTRNGWYVFAVDTPGNYQYYKWEFHASMVEPTLVLLVQLIEGFTDTGTKVSSLAFKPDFVLVKDMDATQPWLVFDSVRGPCRHLELDTQAQEAFDFESLKSFNNHGYTLGNMPEVNREGARFLDLCLKADPASGFEIVEYVGTGKAGHAIAHHLGKKPTYMMVKNRDNRVPDWLIYHTDLGPTKYLKLTSAPCVTSAAGWNDTEPTATHFTVGEGTSVNEVGKRYIAYLFTDSEVFQTFSYTGIYSDNGPFTPLRGPILSIPFLKDATHTVNWTSQNIAADPFNPITTLLYPDTGAPAESPYQNTFTAGGMRVVGKNNRFNKSGGKFVGLAILKSSTKYSNAF